MLYGAEINGVNTLDEYGLMLCADLKIGEPKLKQNLVDIPGGDGALNMSYSPQGRAVYEMRAISFSLFKPCVETERETLVNTLRNLWHGQVVKLVLPNDTTHYWQGILAIGDISGYNKGVIPVSMIAEPYKYAADGTVVEWSPDDLISGDIVSFETKGEYPLSALSVAINPVQDLHGYDSPWIDSDQVNKEPYNFRAVSGTAPRFGTHLYDKLVGGTVVWNQLNNSLGSTQTKQGVTFTKNGDDSWTITGTAQQQVEKALGLRAFYKDHVYLESIGVADRRIMIYLFGSGIIQGGDYNRSGSIMKATESGNAALILYAANGSDFGSGLVVWPQLFDLTQMFGSTIADYIHSLEQATPGAGVAWFRKLFPKPYYAYDAGSLQSVQTSAHKMIGFNQWDGEYTASSAIKVSNGDIFTHSTQSGNVATNYIPVIGGAAYYFKLSGQTSNAYGMAWYDADKNFISGVSFTGSGTVGLQNAPLNAQYCRATIKTADISTACINLSDANHNGQYEAYDAHTYALDSDLELRGISKLDSNNKLYYDGDTYESDGTVTRKYGIVDLGTLTYTQQDTNLVAVQKDNIQTVSGANPKRASTAENLCSCFGASDIVQTTNQFRFTSSVAATDFATTFNGQKLVFEIATPTTESADPFTNPQPFIDAYGTEEYIDAGVTAATPTRDVAIPVGHETYHANICPISGWTGADVFRTGVNVWDEELESGRYDLTTGAPVVAATYNRSKNAIPVLPSTSYYTTAILYRVFYDENMIFVNGDNSGDQLFTTPAKARYMHIYQSANELYDGSNCSINYPSTDHDYHAYSGKVYALTFKDENDNPITVYGGNATYLGGGNWRLTVNRASVEFDGSNDEDWSRQDGAHNFFVINLTNTVRSVDGGELICDKFQATSITVETSNIGIWMAGHDMFRIRYADDNTITPTDLRTYLSSNPIHVVYELATPLTYTLTTEQLTTLLGENNVWADTGEISLPLPYVTLTNERKAVTPTINAAQAATITFDGTSVSVSAGESIIPQLVLDSSSKEVGVASMGAVTFSYREGSL